MLSREILAKIHIAKKALGMKEEEYRDILRLRFDVATAKDLSPRQAIDLLAQFERAGWQPRPRKRPSGTDYIRIAESATGALQKRYVIKLWTMLGYDLPKLHSRIQKQFGVDRLEWLHDHEPLHILITDLEARCRRAGLL